MDETTHVKATARIDRDIYAKVTHRMHAGQMSDLLRRVFNSLSELLADADGKRSVFLYLAGTDELVLPVSKEDQL